MKKSSTDAEGRSLNERLYSKRSAGLPKLAHELNNQLSVISFCRLKIGETFAGDPNKPIKDFEALEDAVQKVARLVKEITNTLSNPRLRLYA